MITTLNLSEVCDIQSGGTPSRSKSDFWNGDIPWSKISDIEKSDGTLIETEESITAEGLKAIRNRIFNPGTLLFAMYGSVGKAAIAGIEVSTNQAILGITIKDETKLDMSYLQHWLGSQQSNFDKDARGVAQKNLSAGYVRDLKIPLPPLKEQKRIAVILDKAEAIRRKRQQAIDLTDQLLRSVFLDMFGDPVTNPKGWGIAVFGDLIDVLTDYHANGSYKILKKHVDLKNTKDYALMVRTTDLESGDFTDNVKWVSESAYTFLKKTKVYGGEILVNKIGSAGAVYLMPHLDIPVSLAMNQFMIRCNAKCNNIFAYHYLKTEHADRQIKERVQGAVTKTITKDAMRSIQFINPPIDLQNKFVDVVKKIENDLADKLNINKLDDLFNSLTQQAFNGELSKQAKAA